MFHTPGGPRDFMPGARFGGGSKGGGETTTVQKSDPWAGQQPYLSNQFQRADQLYNQGKLSPSYYQGQTVAPMAAETSAALDMQSSRAALGSPLVRAGQSQMTDTLSGNYLSAGNPYFSQMMQNVGAAVRPQIDSQFEGSGRYGSGAHQKAMADAMTQAGTQAAYQNYGDERANMFKAALTAPQLAQADYQDMAALGEVGAAREAYAQDQINADMQKYNYNANRDAMALQNYAGLISGNYGGTINSTGTAPTQKSNRLGGALGGAAAGASAGTAIMPGWGTAIGGIAGGLMGAFSS